VRRILFLAHRGGTGRTLCAANCAFALAKRGKRVIVLDLDLEAGGLASVFGLSEPSPEEKPRGVAALFTQRTLLPEDEIVPLPGINANLSVLPVFVNPQAFDANRLMNNSPELFSARLLDLWRAIEELEGYDYLLVDVPSGLNDIRGTLLPVCDRVVFITRPNRQGAIGTKFQVQDIDKYGKPRYIAISSVYGVGSPNTEIRLNEFLRLAGIGANELLVVLPFDEDLSFFEEVVTLTREESPLARAYLQLVDFLLED